MGLQFPQGDGIAETDDLRQFEVLQVRRTGCHEGFDHGQGFRHTGADKNAHTGFDTGQGLFRGDGLLLPVNRVAIDHGSKTSFLQTRADDKGQGSTGNDH
jgi:hypothetical protein